MKYRPSNFLSSPLISLGMCCPTTGESRAFQSTSIRTHLQHEFQLMNFETSTNPAPGLLPFSSSSLRLSHSLSTFLHWKNYKKLEIIHVTANTPDVDLMLLLIAMLLPGAVTRYHVQG
ncbi:hypothetical protein M405DRAFT_363203 [Rhizopogon salebrosus TDB-379]|nr:hypothetical protein M405DRAFT_363203 [Rhizopogon salebrosus TDB-379]